MAYQNFFAAKLYTDIGTSDTTITLDTAPTATSGRMVLEARNPTQREIIKYTGVSGTQLTGVSRGQGGTTAKPHLKNALVEMNVTAEDLSEALSVPSDIVTRFDENLGDFVSSGLVWSTVSGLNGTMTAGLIYSNGYRVSVSSVASNAFAASRDTYVDIDNTGTLYYTAVTNGAVTGFALTAGRMRIAKVVTSGSAITSIVQTGFDALYNPIFPTAAVSPAQINVNNLYSDKYIASAVSPAGEFVYTTYKTYDITAIPTGHLFFVNALATSGSGTASNIRSRVVYNSVNYESDVFAQYHISAGVSVVLIKVAGQNSVVIQHGGAATSQNHNSVIQQLN